MWRAPGHLSGIEVGAVGGVQGHAGQGTAAGERARQNGCMTRIAIVGGGPGGYEAALVGVQYGAEVTLVEATGVGGSTVLTDCVPSKTLIATAEVVACAAESAELGLGLGGGTPPAGAARVALSRVKAAA